METAAGSAPRRPEVVRVRRELLAACMACPLCKKLLRDATTIYECLHTCEFLPSLSLYIYISLSLFASNWIRRNISLRERGSRLNSILGSGSFRNFSVFAPFAIACRVGCFCFCAVSYHFDEVGRLLMRVLMQKKKVFLDKK